MVNTQLNGNERAKAKSGRLLATSSMPHLEHRSGAVAYSSRALRDALTTSTRSLSSNPSPSWSSWSSPARILFDLSELYCHDMLSHGDDGTGSDSGDDHNHDDDNGTSTEAARGPSESDHRRRRFLVRREEQLRYFLGRFVPVDRGDGDDENGRAGDGDGSGGTRAWRGRLYVRICLARLSASVCARPIERRHADLALPHDRRHATEDLGEQEEEEEEEGPSLIDLDGTEWDGLVKRLGEARDALLRRDANEAVAPPLKDDEATIIYDDAQVDEDGVVTAGSNEPEGRISPASIEGEYPYLRDQLLLQSALAVLRRDLIDALETAETAPAPGDIARANLRSHMAEQKLRNILDAFCNATDGLAEPRYDPIRYRTFTVRMKERSAELGGKRQYGRKAKEEALAAVARACRVALRDSEKIRAEMLGALRNEMGTALRGWSNLLAEPALVEVGYKKAAVDSAEEADALIAPRTSGAPLAAHATPVADGDSRANTTTERIEMTAAKNGAGVRPWYSDDWCTALATSAAAATIALQSDDAEVEGQTVASPARIGMAAAGTAVAVTPSSAATAMSVQRRSRCHRRRRRKRRLVDESGREEEDGEKHMATLAATAILTTARGEEVRESSADLGSDRCEDDSAEYAATARAMATGSRSEEEEENKGMPADSCEGERSYPGSEPKIILKEEPDVFAEGVAVASVAVARERRRGEEEEETFGGFGRHSAAESSSDGQAVASRRQRDGRREACPDGRASLAYAPAASAAARTHAATTAENRNNPPAPHRRKRRNFADDEKEAIIDGVFRYGVGKWAKIKCDPDFASILRTRTSVDVKDAYRTLWRRGEVDGPR